MRHFKCFPGIYLKGKHFLISSTRKPRAILYRIGGTSVMGVYPLGSRAAKRVTLLQYFFPSTFLSAFSLIDSSCDDFGIFIVGGVER